jgi:putative transposase
MARQFLEVLYDYRNKSRFLLHEFTLMPEHFHLLITVGPETTLERGVQFIKGGYSHSAGKVLGFKGEVWQRGFSDQLIRDARDFAVHRDYIWQNAVKRGLVEQPQEYPYCSAFPGFELDPVPERFRG